MRRDEIKRGDGTGCSSSCTGSMFDLVHNENIYDISKCAVIGGTSSLSLSIQCPNSLIDSVPVREIMPS